MDVNSDLLTLAIRRGDCTEVESLLDKGLDVNGADSEGYRPLHEAVKGGHLDIVELLLKRSANVNSPTSRFLTTPLHLAAIFGHLEVARLLITYGASLETNGKIGLPSTYRYTTYTNSRPSRVSSILQNESNYIDIKWTYTTPLILAADCDNTEVVKLLIEHGADVNRTNDDGCTVLHIASGYGDSKLVRLVLQKEPDLEAKINVCGSTALHLVSEKGGLIVDLLLHEGADVMARNRKGETPLTIVCDIINSRVSRMFLGCSYTTILFERSAKVIIKFMLLFSKDIEIQNLQYWAEGFCHQYKRKYEENIKQMQACLIKNTTVSLYTFLQALYYDKNKLLKFLSNHQIRQEVKHIDKYISEYTNYSSIIPMAMKKVQEGVRRLDLLEVADTAMKVIAPNLVMECRQIVLNFLSNGDLSSLTESVKCL